MKIQNAVIVGMGALGTMYGHRMTKNLGCEHVAFLVDEERLARYEKSEITANGEPCGFRFVTPQTAQIADLVIFAVKATALEQAMEEAQGLIGKDTVLLSVLNGITSEKLLEERFGKKNVVYCVAQGMDAVRIGTALTYSVMGQLRLGIPQDAPEKQEALDALTELLTRADVAYAIDADIRHRLWSKFMLNVGCNQVVMVYEGNYDTIQRPGKARSLMIAAMHEVRMLAQYEGVNVTDKDVREYVDLMDTLSSSGMPSMRQDGLLRRPSEVELFSGTVRALAKKHGLMTPVNDWLYKTVNEMESKY